jgi:hypothetical protein
MEFNNLRSVLLDYAIALQNKYKDNLLLSDRVATGELVKSVQYKLDFKDKEFIIYLELEDYYKYVENGTKPHFPPVNAILNWIKAKPVLPTPINGKLPTPNQLAYLIGRKISEVGTEGSHDLEKSSKTISEEYEELILEALEKDINEDLDQTFIMFYS